MLDRFLAFEEVVALVDAAVDDADIDTLARISTAPRCRPAGGGLDQIDAFVHRRLVQPAFADRLDAAAAR
jgi:hypothetical protein